MKFVCLALAVLFTFACGGASGSTPQVPTATAPAQVSPTPPPEPTEIPATATIPAAADPLPALSEHLAQTVCSDPPPVWCGAVRGASALGDTLTVRSTLTPADADELRTMMQGLSSFVYNNRYKEFGLAKIVVVSDADGSTLAHRDGLEFEIELTEE